jgi:hypothetical protein
LKYKFVPGGPYNLQVAPIDSTKKIDYITYQNLNFPDSNSNYTVTNSAMNATPFGTSGWYDMLISCTVTSNDILWDYDAPATPVFVPSVPATLLIRWLVTPGEYSTSCSFEITGQVAYDGNVSQTPSLGLYDGNKLLTTINLYAGQSNDMLQDNSTWVEAYKKINIIVDGALTVGIGEHHIMATVVANDLTSANSNTLYFTSYANGASNPNNPPPVDPTAAPDLSKYPNTIFGFIRYMWDTFIYYVQWFIDSIATLFQSVLGYLAQMVQYISGMNQYISVVFGLPQWILIPFQVIFTAEALITLFRVFSRR